MTNDYRKISVYVNDTPSAANAVRVAGGIAETFDARLDGVHVIADSTAPAMAPAAGGMAGGIMLDDLMQQARDAATAAQATFETTMKDGGWTGSWRTRDSDGRPLREAVAEEFLLSDLVVAARGSDEAEGTMDAVIVADAIVDSGRPVVVVPDGWTEPVGRRHVAIAWKPGREAARAVTDAMPFLRTAGSVSVTAAVTGDDDGASADPGADLVDWLKLHGVEATTEPLYGLDDGDVGEALIERAERSGADLLVLGAFSHSRLREALLGGVTRDVLRHTPVPALMAH